MSAVENEVLLDASTLPWLPLVDGIGVKLLRASEETGTEAQV